MQIIKNESDPCNKIIIHSSNEPIHKYAIRAKKYLTTANLNSNGIIDSRSKCPPPIFVSKSSVPRAIQLLDTLLSELEARNFHIRWPKEHKRYFSMKINNIEIGFSISEKLNRKDHKPTREEISEQKKFFWITPPKWDYEPSGKLTLTLLTPENVWNIKHHWNDGKIKRLENQLNEFIIEAYKVPEEYKNAQNRKIQSEIDAAERRR